MTNPAPPSPPGDAPPKGPPAAPGPAGPKGLSWAERQRQEQQRAQQLQAQARAAAPLGTFVDAELERLRMLTGEGILCPREVRKAPAYAVVNNARIEVKDMTIDQGTPEFWVRYLFEEISSVASKKALAAGFAGRGLLLDFYNRVFWRPDDFDTSANPFVVPKYAHVLEGYPAGAAGETLLCSHLRAALDLGFDYIQPPADAAADPLSSLVASTSYLLEIQQKTVHTPLVWRTEDRRTLTELRSTGFTQQVAAAQRIMALGMDQAWNPYSTAEVRGRIWYRRKNTDNCLYTGISVALNPFASVVFPKINLSPTSLAPVANKVFAALQRRESVESVVLDKDGAVKPEYSQYIARLQLPGNQFKLVLYSRARTILMALEGRYLNTQSLQAGGKTDVSQSFPEYGSLGIAGTNIFAQVELHRFFHAWSDTEGFTAFVNTSACDLVSREAIVGCFAEAKAQTEYYDMVNRTYSGLVTGGPYGLSWGATGAGHSKVPALFKDASAAWVDGKRIALA